MKWLLVILVVIATAAPSCDALRKGLRVKFNIGLRPGTDFFFDVPRTMTNAIQEGWSLTARSDSTRSSLILYCPEDRVLCGFFTRAGKIAGLQIAIAKDEFSNAVFDWETQGYTEWNPPALSGGEQKSYWATQVFFISETTTSMNEEEIVPSSSSDDDVLSEDAVWVSGINKEMVKISADADDIADSVFTKQACIIWMGRHYYYNMTADTQCTSSGIFPWFPLVNSGKLEGLGFIAAGQLEKIDGRRDWFERPTELVVKMIVPDGPQCLYDLASTPGLITMHIYFTDQPWFIGCLFN